MKMFAFFCFFCSVASVFGFPSALFRPFVMQSPEGVPSMKYFAVPLEEEALPAQRAFNPFLLQRSLYAFEEADNAEEEAPKPFLLQRSLNSFEEADNTDDDSEGKSPRQKRENAAEKAVNLAMSHQDKEGRDRPVFQPHFDGSFSPMGAGVGSVIVRSDDGRHSLGTGVYVQEGRDRFGGFRPNVGFGLGYRFGW